VLDLLKAAGNNLDLKVITPMDSKSHSNSKVLISKLTQNSSYSNSYFHRSNRHTLVLMPHYPTRAPLESVPDKVLRCRPPRNRWQENLENQTNRSSQASPAARGIRSKGSTVWDDRGVLLWNSSKSWGRIQIIEHLGKSFIELD
jgi:hypothetical protein